MSLEKKSETDVALESKTRFKGFHDNAPHALDFTNRRIDNEIEERENGDDDLNDKITALTNTHNQDIEELGNEVNSLSTSFTNFQRSYAQWQDSINTQLNTIRSDITDLKSRVTTLEAKDNGGTA